MTEPADLGYKACEHIELRQQVEGRTESRRVSSKTFRETYITMSELAGISRAMCMEQVGHLSEGVHEGYMHIQDAPRREAASRMGEVIALGASTGTSASATDPD